MSPKRKNSRFDDLIDAAQNRISRDRSQSNEVQSSPRSKSTDPNYTRTTVYLPKQLHRQLKTAAASEARQMSDIIIELIEEWFEKRNGK
ncbi:CopG family transcriptional regulator [Mastigocoleus sp. MO_188.B34]|uniref:CopG family transcriptional regulator n=1 Tax=Mastigocoleus sp. MO_188.B34 TaxID=3036635 RepID=UPI002636A5D3|nr:CopG family transcriptional regulator [Mastigocoleus sp. MO_188.B34]MDJ0695432.1 CopG family transcriptional regulator [Mastigocoleus sp. MO_188.B34]